MDHTVEIYETEKELREDTAGDGRYNWSEGI